MTYLDNAATTRRKPLKVYIKTMLAITKYNANAGRGGHKLANSATEKIMNARNTIDKYFNGYGMEYSIFTASCTESLNLAILGTIKASSHIITTKLEHNSVLRPLNHLKETNDVQISYAIPNSLGIITPEEISRLITPKTTTLVLTNVSNVIGSENDIYKIGALCKEKNIKFICDCAQSAGHKKIDMKLANISCLAVAGHKGLLGIYGASVLLIDDKTEIEPIKFGGTGTNSHSLVQPAEYPEKLESGSLALPSILALEEGIKYCKKNQSKITNKIKELSALFIEKSKQLKNFKLYNENENGVFAFNIGSIPSTDISNILSSKYNIYCRAGLHCAPLCHEFLGTTNQGAVRISFSCFTKKSYINRLIKALTEISNTL